MIDARRTRQMTKMAIFEENEIDDYKSVVRYEEKSYVSIWTFIYGVLSVIISLVYILVAFYIMLVLNPEGISTALWILFGVVAVIIFVCHIYFYTRYGRRRAMQKYSDKKAKSDYMEEQYKILDEMYK